MKNVNINTKENEKNVVEFIKTIKTNGTGFCTPIIDGKKIPALGFFYTSDTDYETAVNFIKEAVLATGNNIHKIIEYITTAKNILEADINVDEEIIINNKKLILSYQDRKIYDNNTNVIAECTDLENLPNEAIKEILKAKAELALLQEDMSEYNDYNEEEY